MTARNHTLYVYLPADRRGIGDALLCTRHGFSLGPWPVLGKADNRTAARHGNPERDPTLPYGDTPLGPYWPKPVTPVPEAKRARFGDWWLALEGRGGQALAAGRNGRSGLYLHGGRGDQLIATYGCLRLRDRDMAKLQAKTKGRPVRVVITDDADALRDIGVF